MSEHISVERGGLQAREDVTSMVLQTDVGLRMRREILWYSPHGSRTLHSSVLSAHPWMRNTQKPRAVSAIPRRDFLASIFKRPEMRLKEVLIVR